MAKCAVRLKIARYLTVAGCTSEAAKQSPSHATAKRFKIKKQSSE